MSAASTTGSVGGLAGAVGAGTVSNSYAAGSVSGGYNGQGGLSTLIYDYSGGTYPASYLLNSYAAVSGASCGLAQIVDHFQGQSFWDSTIGGTTSGCVGAGLATTAMRDSAAFITAGWDRSVWTLEAGNYPKLYWEK